MHIALRKRQIGLVADIEVHRDGISLLRIHIPAEREHRAHQIRRTAGGAVPLLTFTPIGRDKIVIEEAVAVQRNAAEHGIIEL